MTYYPSMAYHMANLEPPLRPPTAVSGLAGILDDITSGIANLVSGGASAVASTLTAGQKASYCSSANPQPGCTSVAGVCLPMTSSILEVFKNLQRQANRIAAKEGRSLIGVDGRIGPATVNQVALALRYATSDAAAAQGLSWTAIQGKPCDLIAAHADELAARIKTFADASSSPMVADPSTSQPSQPATNGTVVHPPADVIAKSADTGFGQLFAWIPVEVKTPLGIAALALGGYAIWKASGGKKGGGRRGRRRPARRRRGR